MNVTRTAIEKNRVTIAALLVIFFGGVSAFNRLPRAEDPGFVIRTAVVQTIFPGGSPQRVTDLVTDKLEKAIQEIPEVDFLRSESRTGVSLIFVNIKASYNDMRPIWDNLRRKVERAAGDLPDGVIGPVVNDEFGDVFGTILTITGPDFSYAELKSTADEIRDELLRLDDVAKVDIIGAQEERVFVEYNNARLAELGVSPLQLQSVLQAQNIVVPGGEIRTDGERIVLEPTGNFESLDDLAQTIIRIPGRSDLLYLSDIANVRRGYIDPPRSLVMSSGVPALALAVSLREGGDIIRLGEEVQALYAGLPAIYPIGIEFDIVAFQPEIVDTKVSDFVVNVGQSILIVIAVMLFTLGPRTGILVASLIPMAMIASLLVMSFFSIGLDQMSLASLIIALGMLVDNAIVMSESIMVQMAQGKSRLDAAVDSARELAVPLLTSSLTTSAAFLPIFLAESSAGEYTAPLFKVVTITLLCSWVLSLTMIPLLCKQFLAAQKPVDDSTFDTPFYRTYRTLLMVFLKNRSAFVTATLLLFLGSVWMMRFVPNIFFPPSDRPLIQAELALPRGTPIHATAAVARSVEQYISDSLMNVADPDQPHVVNWATFVGQGAPRFTLAYNPEQSRPDYAFMMINASSREAVDSLIPRLAAFTSKNFPGLTPDFAPASLGPIIKYPIEVRLSGPDRTELFAIAEQVTNRLRDIAGVRNLEDDWGPRTKKILVRVNQTRARLAGVSSRDIAASLQTVLSGFTTTEYREGDDIIPVVLRSVAADRSDLGKIDGLNIFSQITGRSVPLKQVADLELAWEPSLIIRRDASETVTIRSKLEAGATSADVVGELVPWLEEVSQSWGVGNRFEIGGEPETSGESQESIAVQLPIAGLIIILLLVGQFNSVRRPAIILMTIPLGLIGVVPGLILLRSYFGFMTMLGIISLAGIVINNAIVLIDRIKIEIEEFGRTPPDAIVEAAQRRLRPILLTTATTVGGLLPLYFGGGVMFEPMAIAIMFGLVFATALTLGFVPVMYSVFFRVSFKNYGTRG